MASTTTQSSESESEELYYDIDTNGIRGYQYEPLRQNGGTAGIENESEEELEEEDDEDRGIQDEDRMGNTNWCQCTWCSVQTLSKVKECICCTEFPSMAKECQKRGKFISSYTSFKYVCIHIIAHTHLRSHTKNYNSFCVSCVCKG